MKKICALLLALSLCLSLALAEVASTSTNTEPVIYATIKMKDLGDIKLELYPNLAPQSVANFVSLAKEGFYNGLIFHRIIKDFMVQGGDPLGTGTGGPGYSIQGEFESNGVPNPISHERGVISFARSSDPNSAGSQFFIVHQNSPFLDGNYAAFGKVIEGMDIIDKMATTSTNKQDRPDNPPIIESITIDENNIALPELVKIEKNS